MTPVEARRAIRHLKRGVCPPHDIELFTAGRVSEMERFQVMLDAAGAGSAEHIFVEGAYGAGKSHLLKAVEARALRAGFATAWVTIDGQAHAFNHPTRYVHCLMENLRVPGVPTRGLSNALLYWIHNNTAGPILKWARHQPRAVFHWAVPQLATIGTDDDYLVDHCLAMVDGRDLQHKSGARFFDEVQDRIAGLIAICRAAGLRGVVLLFDEIETIVTRLPSILSRMLAYEWLHQLSRGKRLDHGALVFATTPDFGRRMPHERMQFEHYKPSYRNAFQFMDDWTADGVPLVKLSPLSRAENLTLVDRLREVHELGYSWQISDADQDAMKVHLIEKPRSPFVAQRDLVRSYVNLLEIGQQHPEIKLRDELAKASAISRPAVRFGT